MKTRIKKFIKRVKENKEITIILLIVALFFAFIILAPTTAVFFERAYKNSYTPKAPAPLPTFTPVPKGSKGPLPTETATEEAVESYTFLLLGNDYSSEIGAENRYKDTQQSDAIILGRIIFSDPVQVNLISIARELYIPKYDIKISQLYSYCIKNHPNVEEAEQRFYCSALYFSRTFGITYDLLFTIDMDGFVLFVDNLGGVVLKPSFDSYDKCGRNFYKFEKGQKYKLDGRELLCFARMRMFSPNGYFDRQERHFDVLFAIQEAVKNNPQFWLNIDDYRKHVGVLFIEKDPSTVFKTLKAIIEYSDIEFSFYSLAPPDIEELPRPLPESPYLYKPVMDLKEWTTERLGK